MNKNYTISDIREGLAKKDFSAEEIFTHYLTKAGLENKKLNVYLRTFDYQNSQFNIQNSSVEYIFEPSPKELIEGLIDHLVRMQVYHLVLEANASEHSARMVAMKTASDNAKELSENLNL